MDAPDGWRLRPTAQPVSYLEPLSGQWISGSFDTAVKSEHPAARSSGVQPQATAGQVPEQLPLDCVGIMPRIRATAALAGQPMPMPPFRAPNPWADAPPVQPQATAGQVPQLPSQTIHQLQSDVNRHEQAELRRQESGAAPQPMPTAVYQAPPPTDSDEADGGYRRQRDRQLHTQFTPSSMSTPQATSQPEAGHGANGRGIGDGVSGR